MMLAPPKSPNGKYYIVPTGIRPVLQKTRIEVRYSHTHTQAHTCAHTHCARAHAHAHTHTHTHTIDIYIYKTFISFRCCVGV